MDTRVLCVILSLGVAINLGSIGAEGILESFKGLGAEFVTVADEQGAGELPCVGDALEQVYGNKSLARAGCKGQQRPLGLPAILALDDLFHDCADSGILIVAPGAFAACVRLQKRPGRG